MSILISKFKVLFVISGFTMTALAFSGCAHTMKSNAALEDARAVYRTAQENPDVARNAPMELNKSEIALKKADQLLQHQGPVAEIEHQAYLAKQHALISEEIGKQKMAESAVERASAERNKVILEARTTEANLAGQNAATQKAAALKAMEEAQTQKVAALKASEEAQTQMHPWRKQPRQGIKQLNSNRKSPNYRR
jgi:PBP1b-binding outer membrane lipoprotein LpoB